MSADEQELKRVAAKYGVRHYHVEMTREITPIKDLLAVWHIYRFLLREKPEIVHTHTPKAGLVGMMAAWLARAPVRMHTVAGLPLMEATGVKRKVLNLVEKITYAFATKVYPNSFAMRDMIISEGFCAPEKLKVLANGSSNGIDTDYFSRAAVATSIVAELRAAHGISENDFVFIFVGRLVGDKGINELVEAFGKVKAKIKFKDEGLCSAKGVASPPVAARNDKMEDGFGSRGHRPFENLRDRRKIRWGHLRRIWTLYFPKRWPRLKPILTSSAWVIRMM